jgi:hypothetical protein
LGGRGFKAFFKEKPMFVKDAISLAIAIMSVLFVTYGPTKFKTKLHELELKILRESTRVDNWGNPSIFKGKYSWSTPDKK